MTGLIMAIKYGIIPCQLNLCGPKKDKTAKIALFKFLAGEEKDEMKIRGILQQFEGAVSCYTQIAQANDIADIFDPQVVEAYWLGNKLLQNCPNHSIHHAFQVYHLYTDDSLGGLMPFTEKLKDICRIGWGIVKHLDYQKNILTVEYQPIIKQDSSSILGIPELKPIKWDKRLLAEVHINDCVSTHWNHAIEILDKIQQANLQKWTLVSLHPLV